MAGVTVCHLCHLRARVAQARWNRFYRFVASGYKALFHLCHLIPLEASIYGDCIGSIIDLKASCNRINPRGIGDSLESSGTGGRLCTWSILLGPSTGRRAAGGADPEKTLPTEFFEIDLVQST